jgi:dTDP-glucose 4,6-dehydratase
VRVCVLGGAGFVGSHLCEALVARGDTVVCADNLLTGRAENVAHLPGERFTYVQADVREPLALPGPFDAVMNLASPASPVDYFKLPIETLGTGAWGSLHALDLARRDGARYLFASTSEVYGDPHQHPQKESYWGNVNPIGLRSCYDEAKRFGEALTMAYRREHELDTRIARIFNTYGPRNRMDDGRVVPTFIVQALRGEELTVHGEGKQTRSFCYVTDLVDGLVRLVDAPAGDALDTPVNLGNPKERSILEFAQAVLRATGARVGIRRAPPAPDDPKQRCPDITRAKSLLGWEPRVDLDEGLQRTVEWYRAQLAR